MKKKQVQLQFILFLDIFLIIISNTIKMQREEELSSSTFVIDQQQPICRICLESKQPIITLPCSCLSDNSQIHWQCLNKVQQFRKNSQCDICKSKFTVKNIYTDLSREFHCNAKCMIRQVECCSFTKLVAKIVLFIGGFMLALTPVYFQMKILYTYLCIGCGGLLIYLSIPIKPDMYYVQQFLKNLLCNLCCCYPYCEMFLVPLVCNQKANKVYWKKTHKQRQRG